MVSGRGARPVAKPSSLSRWLPRNRARQWTFGTNFAVAPLRSTSPGPSRHQRRRGVACCRAAGHTCGTEIALAKIVNLFCAPRPHHANLFANRWANRITKSCGETSHCDDCGIARESWLLVVSRSPGRTGGTNRGTARQVASARRRDGDCRCGVRLARTLTLGDSGADDALKPNAKHKPCATCC